MSYHRRGDVRGWIVGGIGLAIGFALFKLFAVLLGLVALGIWAGTADWTPGWRGFARGTFVLFLAFVVLVGIAFLFTE